MSADLSDSRPDLMINALAERFGLPPDLKIGFLKLLGDGFDLPLDLVDVLFEPLDRTALLG
jgi:hypothetical protein